MIEMKREEFIASVRHIALTSYQIAVEQEYNKEMSKDQFVSLLNGVRYQDENPNTTSEENHNNWMKMKISQGWIYGSKKNSNLKTHPDLVPYNQLSKIEQLKDTANLVSHKLASALWDEMDEVIDTT